MGDRPPIPHDHASLTSRALGLAERMSLYRVEYAVTDFGRSLGPILEQMRAWGSAFKQRMLAAEAEGEAG